MSSFNFKKKYGQNFLKDKAIIQNIVNSINAQENDLIIEIGPGAGALTKELLQKQCHLLAYEVDLELQEVLSPLISNKTTIIFDDFLNRKIKEDIQSISYNNLYIIGNLPYYITTPIIQKIIDSQLEVKECVFMVQKEVAERFSASPNTKEYGSISVFLNYYFYIKKLFNVKKGCFVPSPNVDSAVIKLISKEKITTDIQKFNKFVRDAFQFKRKNLKNNLKSYNLEKIEEILNAYGYSLQNRAEDLPYEIYVELANRY